jgi:hypothetical protein
MKFGQAAKEAVMDISGLGFGSTATIADRGKAEAGSGALFSGLVAGAATSVTEEASKLLREMTEGGLAGYWKWMIKTMRERLRDEVMQGMGVTQEQLNAMPPDQRKDIEAKITEEVERRLKAWVEQQIKKQSDVADQQKLEQTMAALGVAAEMVDPAALAEGKKQGGVDWLNLDGKENNPVQTVLAALPLTAGKLREAGYRHDDIVRRIIEGRLQEDAAPAKT